MKRIDRAYIMAAGMGNRMSESTASKPMTKVGGKHLIQYGLEALEEFGIPHIYVIYGDKSLDVLELKELFPSVVFCKQKEVKGSLSTLGFLGKFAKVPFLLLDADIIISKKNFAEMLQSISEKENVDAYFAAVKNPVMLDKSSLHIEHGMVSQFKKEGFAKEGKEYYQGGMIYLWLNFPLAEIEKWLSASRFSMAEFLEAIVQKYKIGVMFIDVMWDVDTLEEIKISERLLAGLNS